MAFKKAIAEMQAGPRDAVVLFDFKKNTQGSGRVKKHTCSGDGCWQGHVVCSRHRWPRRSSVCLSLCPWQAGSFDGVAWFLKLQTSVGWKACRSSKSGLTASKNGLFGPCVFTRSELLPVCVCCCSIYIKARKSTHTRRESRTEKKILPRCTIW